MPSSVAWCSRTQFMSKHLRSKVKQNYAIYVQRLSCVRHAFYVYSVSKKKKKNGLSKFLLVIEKVFLKKINRLKMESWKKTFRKCRN